MRYYWQQFLAWHALIGLILCARRSVFGRTRHNPRNRCFVVRSGAASVARMDAAVGPNSTRRERERERERSSCDFSFVLQLRRSYCVRHLLEIVRILPNQTFRNVKSILARWRLPISTCHCRGSRIYIGYTDAAQFCKTLPYPILSRKKRL